MQIVIEIPDSLYEAINAVRCMEDSEDSVVTNLLFDAVISGTVLPKGHGRLIDANALEKEIDTYCIDAWSGEEAHIIDANTVKLAQTIIAADKGE